MSDIKKQPHITICPKGPMIIEGTCELRDTNNCIIQTADEMRLCRCGHSHHMPFCDESHATKEWPDSEGF